MKTIYQKQKTFYKNGYTQSKTFREHQLILLRKALKKYDADLKEALFNDLGKDAREATLSEIFMVQNALSSAIKNIEKFSGRIKKKTPLILFGAKSYTRYLPYGNTLIMNAYNYPLLLSLEPLIGAIAAGNTVMLALSKKSSYTNKVIINIINECYEEYYIYAFETDRQLNQQLFDIPFDKVFFTGSQRVGKHVYLAAAKHLSSVTLELGGKSPAIVLRDADLKASAKQILYSKGLNSGQTCIATDYILVDAAIEKDFINELIKQKNMMYPNLDSFPKFVDKDAYNKTKKQLELDKDYIVSAGEDDEDAQKVGITLLSIPHHKLDEAASMQAENFNTILPILSFKSMNEAIEITDKYPNPLALYVFGKRRMNIDYVIDHIASGGVCVNSTLLHMVNDSLPFGGFKQSGIGSYHGRYSFKTFASEQAVMYTRTRKIQNIILPPYRWPFKK